MRREKKCENRKSTRRTGQTRQLRTRREEDNATTNMKPQENRSISSDQLKRYQSFVVMISY
jgi:hypothetical protein